MVFLTAINLGMRRFLGNRGQDRYWKRRRTFSLAGHLYGRHRNCYKLSIRGMLRTLKKCTIGRRYKREDNRELHNLRINSGAQEHGLSGFNLREGIQRCLVLLNRKSLADLAIWEPRTFKALTDVAKAKVLGESDLKYEGMKDDVSHVFRRDLLHEKK